MGHLATEDRNPGVTRWPSRPAGSRCFQFLDQAVGKGRGGSGRGAQGCSNSSTGTFDLLPLRPTAGLRTQSTPPVFPHSPLGISENHARHSASCFPLQAAWRAPTRPSRPMSLPCRPFLIFAAPTGSAASSAGGLDTWWSHPGTSHVALAFLLNPTDQHTLRYWFQR